MKNLANRSRFFWENSLRGLGQMNDRRFWRDARDVWPGEQPVPPIRMAGMNGGAVSIGQNDNYIRVTLNTKFAIPFWRMVGAVSWLHQPVLQNIKTSSSPADDLEFLDRDGIDLSIERAEFDIKVRFGERFYEGEEPIAKMPS